jgi:hypothetical protein
MESKINEPLFLKIERQKYWRIVYSFLKEKTKQEYGSFDDWHESDSSHSYSYLVDYKMGIRICDDDDEEELPEDEDFNFFYFRIVDNKKCLWAKLKYGI